MPKDTLISLQVTPIPKTLGKGIYFGNQIKLTGSGDGYVSLIDADREVVRSYDISSETYSISYSMPGVNLFRGQFSFSGTDFEGEIRIPLDVLIPIILQN